jgi:hypothetical protein
VLLELKHAARRQAAEAGLQELPQLARRVAEELAQMAIETEVGVLAAGDVEDGEDVLVPAAP